MSEWVQTHLPCPDCGSSDALSINTEGWAKCFACGKNTKVDENGEPQAPQSEERQVVKGLLPLGEIRALPKRQITLTTCQKFGYFITKYKDKVVQVVLVRVL